MNKILQTILLLICTVIFAYIAWNDNTYVIFQGEPLEIQQFCEGFE